MPEPIEIDRSRVAPEERWVTYNAKMAELFIERDKYSVGSAERDAAAQKILELCVAEG